MNIILNKSKIYEGSLILVNAEYPLRGESAEELVPVREDCPDILLRRDAAAALTAALERISAENNIVPVSGYRSAEEQTKIYNDSLRESGAEFTRKYVALPQHSEHQTGLAIDLGLRSEHIDFIRPDFPYEGICEAFRKASPGFGFIERYPAGRESVTGIAHEPWHFRYVGCPHAEIMTDRGLTLEEYTELIKKSTPEQPLLYRETEIYYIPAVGESTAIALPEGVPYHISGNNADGFIVTVGRRK